MAREIGPVVAPAGTDVEIEVVVLAVTVASVLLNLTTLLEGVTLKLVPVMVTEFPTPPEAGAKEVIVGERGVSRLVRMLMVPRERFATAKSGRLSLFTSPAAIDPGYVPTE